jgi:hypothetical protein
MERDFSRVPLASVKGHLYEHDVGPKAEKGNLLRW